ncbi:hypothetical protein UA08_00742 [Talaromyces atroroseus]|uniref:Protein kinase domain-containing protein n=1 Tax=Talaromyces atroroseus TaxID=1441469 RepID=A0A225B3M7_TALAT|nr:hypothetical protein UA08_00742 [Talaromyces atroroseus]OKL64318.1 hypothetical protein UA08_00742 [Talaromyces atroroseus]
MVLYDSSKEEFALSGIGQLFDDEFTAPKDASKALIGRPPKDRDDPTKVYYSDADGEWWTAYEDYKKRDWREITSSPAYELLATGTMDTRPWCLTGVSIAHRFCWKECCTRQICKHSNSATVIDYLRKSLKKVLYDNTDVESIRKIDEWGSTILHSLAMEDPSHIFSMLIDLANSEQKRNSAYQQIDVNHRDSEGCTLLHRAVEAGNIPVVNVLLSEGADLNAGDGKQDTPLHFAARYDQEVTKETLIDQEAALTMRNVEKKTPLELSWAKKSLLRWDLYKIDEALTRSKRMSIGAQAECHGLKKQLNYSGPDFTFCEIYSLLRLPHDERYCVHKALLRENQVLQRLEHPFIVSYIGYEELDSGEARLYLEYCECGDLQTMHVKASLPTPQHMSDDEDDLLMLSSKLLHITSDSESIEALKEPEIWTMLYPLSAALVYPHYSVCISRQGACRFEHHWDPVFHRDIKPHNVVLTTLPNGHRIVKLCDLGIARPFINVNQSRPSDRGSQGFHHRHASDPYLSLENELGHKPGGLILQAFLRIAKNLDITTFGTQTSIMQRKRLLARLKLLLKDGVEVPFQEHSRSLHLAILLNKNRMLETLLLKWQNPDETWQNSGWTPLHLAAQQGNTGMAEKLLEANADPATLDRHDILELFLEFSNSKPKAQVPRKSWQSVFKDDAVVEVKRDRREPEAEAQGSSLS